MRLLASLALAATATIGVASAAPHHGHHPNTRLRKGTYIQSPRMLERGLIGRSRWARAWLAGPDWIGMGLDRPYTKLRRRMHQQQTARDGADAAAAGANDGGDMVKKALDDAPKQWWGNGNGGGNAPPGKWVGVAEIDKCRWSVLSV